MFMTLYLKKTQNTHSFQAQEGQSLGLSTYQGTKPTSANVRIQELFQASSLTATAWNQRSITRKEMRKHNYMETKEHATNTLRQMTALKAQACRIHLHGHQVVSGSWWPHGQQPARLPCPWDFLGENTGVSCHLILQWVFLIQGSNTKSMGCSKSNSQREVHRDVGLH